MWPGKPEKLPAGPGRKLSGPRAHSATRCNSSIEVTTPSQWQLTVERMLSAGAKVPPAQVDTVVPYLAKNFPEKPLPPAVIVPGNANVVFREWTAPTKELATARPFAAAGSSIWYSGMYANVPGRIDPKTGAIKEYGPEDGWLWAARSGRR